MFRIEVSSEPLSVVWWISRWSPARDGGDIKQQGPASSFSMTRASRVLKILQSFGDHGRSYAGFGQWLCDCAIGSPVRSTAQMIRPFLLATATVAASRPRKPVARAAMMQARRSTGASATSSSTPTDERSCSNRDPASIQDRDGGGPLLRGRTTKPTWPAIFRTISRLQPRADRERHEHRRRASMGG